MYHFKADMNPKYTYRYAVDSINLDTNKLFLVNPNFKIVECKLKPVN
jgi:hypothetical protein